MFSAIGVSSIRRAPLPKLQCLNRSSSTSYVTAAQYSNNRSDYEHRQHAHAHKHQHPNHPQHPHFDQASDRPLTIRGQPFPIGVIRRVFKPGGSRSDDGDAESRTSQHIPSHIRTRLSNMLTRSQDIHRLLGVIHTRVRSRRDGLDLLSNTAALIEALQKPQSPFRILRAINIIFARLRYVGVEPNKELLVFGILSAARAGSFEALRRHLSQTVSHGYNLGRSEIRSLLQNLHEYLSEYYKEDNKSWDGRRRKQQLLQIVTGWQCDGVPRPGEERQHGICMVMQGFEIRQWEYYIFILRIAGGKDILVGEWLNFKRALPNLTSLGKDNISSARSLHPTDERIRIAGFFARNLVLANDAEGAWQVVQDTCSDVEAVDDTTWSLLLDHPQHIKSWQPAMAEKVLHKYEESIIEIEAAMGITWSGGEDGYHVSSNQDESAEEWDEPEEPEEPSGRSDIHTKARSLNGRMTSKNRPLRQVGLSSGGRLTKQTRKAQILVTPQKTE